MKEAHFKTLLKKYQEGKATASDKEHIRFFENQLKKKNANQIFTNDQHKEELKSSIIGVINRKISKPSFYWSKIAAILVLLLGVHLYRQYVSHSNTLYNEVTSGPEVKYYILPDSTQVWLNKSSKLQFANHFNETRDVILEGEAFFMVKKDQNHPFKVRFEGNELEVTGTQFTVNSKKTKQEVAIKEGSVTVTTTALEAYDLKVNNVLKITGQSSVKSIEEFPRSGYWSQGALLFNNMPMHQVLEIVSKRFGQTIRIENIDKGQLGLRISAKFTEDISVFDLLNSLTHITPFTLSLIHI